MLMQQVMVNELIPKAGRSFTERPFQKNCVLQVSDILCPEKRNLFNNLALPVNMVAEHISTLSSNNYVT